MKWVKLKWKDGDGVLIVVSLPGLRRCGGWGGYFFGGWVDDGWGFPFLFFCFFVLYYTVG